MHDFTWVGWISDHINHDNFHIFTASFVTLILIGAGLLYKKSLKSIDAEVIPDGKFSLKNVFQVLVEKLLNIMEDIVGKEDAPKYFPLIGGIFIYVFLNNLLGVIPGFLPATEVISTNWAIGITVFLYYNYVGIKKNGLVNYFKHFMGPVWWLAWLMLPIELISHAVRPISLGIRLYGNMVGDHTVISIFLEQTPYVVPVIFLVVGIFVSFIQAFVFSLLSTVYIGLASAHDDEEH
jgi:F-type H+-transporting ATPase subunit a